MKTFRQIVHDLRLVYPENEARALARWLCEERFGLSQTDLLLDKDNQLSADDLEVVREITSRLIKHEPIQYILGHTDFCGHRFAVGPGVLIPRPETAELVGHILRYAGEHPVRSILDIGTGSGCIALSLSLALPDVEVTAWDVSPEALAIARQNVDSYPKANVRLEQVDIFNPPADDRQWDLIVSNPPYVRESEARQMERNVLEHEPRLALFVPDDDPLRYYRAIVSFLSVHLSPCGTLWLEINEALGEETSHFIEKNAGMEVVILKDSFERNRMLCCTKLPNSKM